MKLVEIVRHVLEYCWTIIFFLINSLLFTCISLIGFVLWFLIGTWNTILFKKIIFNIADLTWCYCVLILERWGRAEIFFYGDHIPIRETAIVIMNHKTLFDWLFLFSVAGRRGRLGVLKFFAKKAISYIPGFGWGITMLDSIYLHRNWLLDHKVIMESFATLKKRKLPFWTVSFLEGTRATPEKIKASQEFCKSKNLPILQNVIYPRTKGFVVTMIGLRSVIDAVYDITFAINNSKISLLDLAMRRIPNVHIHIKRHVVSQLPKDDASLCIWLQNAWINKDKILDYFEKHNTFPDPASPKEWSKPFQRVSLDIWKYKNGE